MMAISLTKMPPNFWMTEEFVELKDLEWIEKRALVGWKDKEEDEWYFPPWDTNSRQFRMDFDIYAGFLGQRWAEPAPLHSAMTSTLLDSQYIYDPYQFNDPIGKSWKTYRKNIRKYSARNKGKLSYRRLKIGELGTEIEFMLLNWAEGKEIYDPEVMARFLFYGNNRWGLFLNEDLVGVNVGDENCKHRIFRYCLDDGTPFLNEFLRHLFYRSPFAQDSGMMINDGGDLGNEGLARFKKRLNPISIHKVYSHERRI